MSEATSNLLGLAGRRWRRVLVVGLGLSGKAAAHLLLARGVETWGVDQREVDELGIDDLLGLGLVTLAGESAALPAGLVVFASQFFEPETAAAEARERGLWKNTTLIERFSVLVTSLSDVISEIDVNPVIANASGAVAVDALVVAKPRKK